MTDLTGLAVALATPFDNSDNLDVEAFRRLVRHVAASADMLVALGTTGEAATLTDDERDAVITVCVEESAGKPVVVGTGSNCTRQAVAWAQRAHQLGAAAALVVTPYYNKPTTQGLVAHYAAIAKAASGLPVIAYNVPGRTGQNLSPQVVLRLWGVPQVAAVKESSGDLVQIGEIARQLPPRKILLSGDDNLALPSIASGAAGLVSVLGNVMPAEMKALVEAARAGRRNEALAIHQRLLPLMGTLFCESNPIPLKALLEQRGFCEARVRLPLTPATDETQDALAAAWVFAKQREAA